jgi:hypothetical protein
MNRIKIAFSVDGDDFSSSVVAPESGSTRVYIFDLSGYGDPESVSVAPIFAVENREKEGPETSAAVIGKEKVAADVVGSAYLGTVYSLGEDYTFDIGEGLVAYWRFEGNMEDSSENGNEGSLINMAPESGNWVDGKVGKALSFDGVDDYVNIPDNQSLDITDEITIGMWVMTNSQADPLSKHWNIMRVILFEGNNTKVVYQIGGANITTSSFDNVIQTGSWHHIVWTYNGSLTQVYVDGDPNGFSKEASGDLLTSSNPLYIGRYSDRYFNGLIDELMIYDRALSAEEIKNLYDIQKD